MSGVARRARHLLAAGAVLSIVAAMLAPGHVTALEANEPSLASQLWNMHIIGAPSAWQRGVTGKGVTIAVIDSGVDASHEDLAPNMVAGRDFTSPGTPPDDDNGHGTHVAGIAAAVAGNGRGVAGVAPEARIMPVKVLTSTGAGVSNIDEAIKWAVDSGAQVVNLSLGDITDPILPGNEGSYLEGIRYAWSKGAICVVASGNTYGLDSSYGDVPAILVAATTRNDGVASYSNRVGRARWAMAAPGGSGGEPDGVLSTYWFDGESNSYAYNSGTSMAAPHVAGALALLRSAGLSPEQAVERLLATAKDLGPAGRDDDFGHGRLDVAKATEGLGQTSVAGPGGGAATTAPPATASPTTAAPAGGGRRTGAAPAPPPTAAAPTEQAALTPAPPVTEATPATVGSLPSLEPPATEADEEVSATPLPIEDDVSPLMATVAGVAFLGAGGASAWFVRRRISS